MAYFSTVVITVLLGFTFNAACVPLEAYHGRKLLGTTTEETPAPAQSSTSETKTFWEKIEEFYADKNNFAMYLVLPAIVLVYGGCAMIYCIAKCRQYFKRKKDKKDKKRLQDDVDDGEYEEEAFQNNNNNERKMSTVTNDRSGTAMRTAAVAGAYHDRPYSKASVSDVKMEQAETPLPWQIPDDSDPYAAKPKQPPPARPPPPKHRAPHESVMSDYPEKKHPPPSQNHYSHYPEKTHIDNKKDIDGAFEMKRRDPHDDMPRKVSPRPQPVPHHDNPRRHHNSEPGMMSPPPPYESHQHHAMGAAIFTVDYNRDRQRDDIPRKVPARPMYNPNPKVKVISQTRGGGPVSDLEAQAMARHAAQLLRIDDKPGPGMPGYKKPKRLVFVAE